MEIDEERSYIVYLEVDVTVKGRLISGRQAEKIAKDFVSVTTNSPLVEIDETRVFGYEAKRLTRSMRPRRRDVTRKTPKC